MDKHHHGWTAPLGKETFALMADHRPVPILDITPEQDLPKVFAVLIDVSGSMLDKKDYLNKYAIQVFRALENENGKGTLGVFGKNAALGKTWMSSAEVENALSQLRPTSPGSVLFDTIADMSVRLAELSEADTTTHKWDRQIFVITDGLDQHSKSTPDEALKVALQNRVSVSFVGLLENVSVLSQGDFLFAKATMNRIASSSGGFAILLTGPEEISRELQQLLGAQYHVTFAHAGNAYSDKSIKVQCGKALISAPKVFYQRDHLRRP